MSEGLEQNDVIKKALQEEEQAKKARKAVKAAQGMHLSDVNMAIDIHAPFFYSLTKLQNCIQSHRPRLLQTTLQNVQLMTPSVAKHFKS
jgi:hypothetical protein